MDKLDHCLTQLFEPEFAEHIWTDTTTVTAVGDRIADMSGLRLAPNTDGRVLGMRVTVGHARW